MKKNWENKWHGSTQPLFCPSFPCGICLLYRAWNAHILPTWHRTWHVWKKTHQRPCHYHFLRLFDHCLFLLLPLQIKVLNQNPFKNWCFRSFSIYYPLGVVGGCSCCLISAFNVPASLNASSDPMSSNYSRYKWASVFSRAVSSGNLVQTHMT